MYVGRLCYMNNATPTQIFLMTLLQYLFSHFTVLTPPPVDTEMRCMCFMFYKEHIANPLKFVDFHFVVVKDLEHCVKVM